MEIKLSVYCRDGQFICNEVCWRRLGGCGGGCCCGGGAVGGGIDWIVGVAVGVVVAVAVACWLGGGVDWIVGVAKVDGGIALAEAVALRRREVASFG